MVEQIISELVGCIILRPINEKACLINQAGFKTF